MKTSQININHCEAAQDLLSQMVRDNGADVAIIAEPYRIPQSPVWVADETGKAAIWACGVFPLQEVARHSGFVRAKVNGVHFLSCYAPPSLDQDGYIRLMDAIVTEATGLHPIVIAGDFNAWAVEWGSRRTNARGRILLEAFAVLDVTLANRGSKATFCRNGRESVIDVTFGSHRMAESMNWHVGDEYTYSDHMAIWYTIETSGRSMSDRTMTRTGWTDRALDEGLFLEVLRGVDPSGGTAEDMATFLIRKLAEACDAAMPRKSGRTNSRKPVHWWNDEIRHLRTDCLRMRRRSKRPANEEDRVEIVRQFKQLRRDLKRAIKRSKKDNFVKICRDADINPWGDAYRVVMSRIKGKRAPQEKCPLLLSRIVSTLFPQHPRRMTRQTSEHEGPHTDTGEVPEVTAEEILEAGKRIGTSKAPGPDAIPNKALKTAVRNYPEMFAKVMGACLREGRFPKRWKRQHLVLLPKPGKPPGVPSAYRPICLLDTAGKILERIILNRLIPFTEGDEGLSSNQYGFRRARSTIDAINEVVDLAKEALRGSSRRSRKCLIMTLDVRNAFNTANWTQIIRALRRMNIPDYLMKILEDYLADRILLYDNSGGTTEYEVTAGVPQGSVLGPTLWNVMYDGVLRLAIPSGTRIVGFADDVAVVVTARSIDEIQLLANEVASAVSVWMEKAGLQLAGQKTEAVLISRSRPREIAEVRVGEHIVTTQRELKYLGIVIDDRLSFKNHVRHASEKASRTSMALSWMMPNVGGPKSGKRRLLSGVTTSVLLYGAPIWSSALAVADNRRCMASVHRLGALRTISAFRTVSAQAAGVLAGRMPIHIAADETRRVHEAKRRDGRSTREILAEERARSYGVWQEEWDASDKGRWTYVLLPDVEKWSTRKCGELDYHLTQILTGHGCFRSYLYKRGYDTSPECPMCSGVMEDAKHVMFECPRFDNIRSELNILAGVTIDESNIIDEMLASSEKWKAIADAAARISKELRRQERARAVNR